MIHDGWNIVVFPEGTRSKDGWVQRFRHGTARLAEETGIPIVPVAIRGAYAAMPRGRSWPRKGRFPITVRYGDPIVPEQDEDFRSVAGRVMQAVARLWDEDKTDWYRSLRREAEGLTPSPSGPTAARWRRIWESSRPLPTAASAAPGRPRTKASEAATSRCPRRPTAPPGSGSSRRPSAGSARPATRARRLDAVATAAGVRKQTLLYYFPTKDALLEACVGEVSTKVGGVAQALAAQETPSPRRPSGHPDGVPPGRTVAGASPVHPRGARMSPEVIERFAAGLEPLRRRALSFLQRGMSEGAIRRQDPALLLFTLYTAVVGSLTEAGVLRAVVGEDHRRRRSAAANRRCWPSCAAPWHHRTRRPTINRNAPPTELDAQGGLHTMRKHLARAMSVAAAAALSLTMLPGTASAAFPGQNGRIAFESGRTDEFDIYTAKPDGSDVQQLTGSIMEDHRPRWSPDGTRIVFFRKFGDGPANIWVMNADGSDLTRLTATKASEEDPAWSPDGERIVFWRASQSHAADLWIMDADGSNQHRLTSSPASDYAPSWSSTDVIAFTSFRTGNGDVYTIHPDGSGFTG